MAETAIAGSLSPGLEHGPRCRSSRGTRPVEKEFGMSTALARRIPAAVLLALALAPAVALAGPEETVRSADQVLSEIMAIPGRRIPEMLLAEAQGVVVVP